ncbi:MAG: ATP-dependent DNA helicase [Nitrososphaera sp.]|jgi:DNA helicase-2/ATP-dependent DNA helicase PcrA
MQVLLNKEQEEAVNHSGSPLLVAAGPGSGKTKVIVERIKHLVEQGLKPSEILCLTFSEKAALEMRERLEKIIDVTDMQISTFHSFCNDVLADNVLDSGIGIGSGVINRSSLLVWALKHIDTFGFEHIELGNNAVNVIEAMVDGISTFKDELITPDELADYLDKKLNGTKKLVEDVIQIDYLQKLCDLHKLYVKHQEYLRKSRLIDFDDMVSLTIQLFKKKPNVLSKYQKQFKHVLEDEFQDSNFAQLELVKLLAPSGNITVVGDDDQSIYRFQGAYVANFEHFIKSYDNKVKIVILKQNYRSTKNIVKLASELLTNVPNRQIKELFSENEEGEKVTVVRCGHDMAEVEYVVSKIRSILGTKINRRDGSPKPVSYSDFTILSRRRADGRKFAQALNAYGIPATFVGEANIFNSSTGRDLLAYLDIANNPILAGLAINRVLKNSGISETNIAKINQEAKKRKNSSETNSDFVFDVLTDLDIPEIDQLDELFEISKQLQELTSLQHENTVSESVFKIMMKITDLYKSATQDDSLQNRKKQTILKELYHLSLEFESQNKNGTLNDFIDYLRLLGEFDVELEENAEISDAVQVSTIHQSKGKEFPIVFVVDVAQGKLPLRYQAKKFYVPNDLAKGLQREDDEKALALQEERRLFYVAMTRAQNLLYVIFPTKYAQNVRASKPSVFLEEIDFENNPLVDLVDFSGTTQETLLQEQNKIDMIRQDLQSKATKFVNQLQLESAIARIVDLSKVEYFEKNGTLDGFNTEDLFNVESNKEVESLLVDEKIPLINKESLKLSASKFETYLKCPLQFKFAHVLEVPTPEKTYFNLGTAVHAVVEHLTKLEKDGIKPTEEKAFEILESNWNSNAYLSKKKEEEDKEKARTMIRTYLKWISTNPNTPIDVEKRFQIEIGGIKVNGSIDRVEQTPGGEYQVIDFKTGNVYETKNSIKEDTQMNVYALAVENLYKKLPEKTSLFYLKEDKVLDNEIKTDNLEKVKSKLEGVVKSILDEEFKANPEKGACFSCSFRSICDYVESE